MAMAKLHLICGNCGCNDKWEWQYHSQSVDMGDGTFRADVYLLCRNCSIIHSLYDHVDNSRVNNGEMG